MDEKESTSSPAPTHSSASASGSTVPAGDTLGQRRRMLNDETLQLLNNPVSHYARTPMDFQVAKLIGIILETQGFSVSAEFLDELTDLALIYLHQTVDGIKKFTEIQRRTKPSLNDIRYSFNLRDIDYSDLYRSGLVGKKVYNLSKVHIDAVNQESLQKLVSLQQVSFEPESEPFFMNQTYEITSLVPRHVAKPNYIPSYFPDFPPDYTFQNTANYRDTLTDMEKLRVKLVQESRLTEKSLYNLIEEDVKYDTPMSEDTELDSIMSSEMETPGPRFEEHKPPELPEYADDADDNPDGIIQAEAKKQPVASEKPFDVLAYAQKRLEIKARRSQEIEQTRKKRAANIYLQAETYYSPYGTESITLEKQKEFDGLIEKDLHLAMVSVKAGMENQKLHIQEILAERAKLEKQREAAKAADTIEFGFNFNNNSIDSDSDSDADGEDMQEILFGTDTKENSFPTDRETKSPESSMPPSFTPSSGALAPESSIPGASPEPELKLKLNFSAPASTAFEAPEISSDDDEMDFDVLDGLGSPPPQMAIDKPSDGSDA
ncbi:hypothetical protein PSN45_005176 [Yamadazyma tenuis]|uniref:Transcription initiation factor TFIID subunit 8 n=1 Tax=Candida tenuis (strain ATCC 10573 / BCRC 21748 / CBS 615 / JCM 9827 / NBRC 10315 / NRRL Y-1498 / VKM Y-70) TaxID=590646 RepID=G3B0X1_CANTC|nr:uncharacterized protein CANTEDRAFT_93060 [Yamadazyma tenuis ATCC 10573]EGV64830.1 hypothetical protein CANTEDRAFT_93060 [Yamadazyma tenuis ATCC 10573]WEJ97620.1 hypothetical protein PSN45_005176 [Yamadazyma tenuis]